MLPVTNVKLAQRFGHAIEVLDELTQITAPAVRTANDRRIERLAKEAVPVHSLPVFHPDGGISQAESSFSSLPSTPQTTSGPTKMKLSTCLVLIASTIAFTHAQDSSGSSTMCPTFCDDLWAPVCGSNGVTYANECNLQYASCESSTKITKESEGECPKVCPDLCAEQHAPVCGSDGVTYTNQCWLLLADCDGPTRVTKAHEGECATTAPSGTGACEFPCSVLNQPVCGSDGVTYLNVCWLDVAACETHGHITQLHTGECGATSESTSGSGCSDVCPAIYKPVCGSDGVTYANDCKLHYAECTSHGVITKASEGNCSQHSEAGSGCSGVCPEIWRPVCGSDGVTYPNSCFLDTAICKSPYTSLAHNGTCEGNSESNSTSAEGSQETTSASESSSKSSSSACPDICVRALGVFSPVCGSDGVTYDNECELELASCKNPDLHLTKVSDGACSTKGSQETTSASESSSKSSSSACPDICVRALGVFSPVCGSDGVTYDNGCELELASCKNPDLHLTRVSDGPCPVECKTAY